MNSFKWKSFADRNTDPQGDIKNAMAQALAVQANCRCVGVQPALDSSHDPSLQQVCQNLNATLNGTKEYAQTYLNSILTSYLDQVNSLRHFIEMEKSMIGAYRSKELSAQELAGRLSQVSKEEIPKFEAVCSALVNQVEQFLNYVNNAASAFSSMVAELIYAIADDGGLLQNLQREVEELDKNIATATAGAASDIMGTPGCRVVIALGAASDAFTGGGSTVAAAVALLETGAAANSGYGISLIKLLKEKDGILGEAYRIKTEAAQAYTIAGNLQTLRNSTESAFRATQQLSATWKNFQKNLQDLIDDLNLDEGDSDDLVFSYLSDIEPLYDSCETIFDQFASMKQLPMNKDKSIAAIAEEYAGS